MLKELNYDITTWWNEQSFQGKDLFKINELGALSLCSYRFLKERNIAYPTLENADTVLKNLQEKFLGVDAKVKEIEHDWNTAEDKLKLIDKIEHLKDFFQHVNAVGDFETHVKVILDWEQVIQTKVQENYNAKLKLVELAEGLVDAENFKEVSQAFRDLLDKWKNIGYLDKNRNEKLFSRLEIARKKFHERKRHFIEEEEKDMKNNLDLRIEIVDQAEMMATSIDWKNTTEAFQKLLENWKALGRTPAKKTEELWQRFMAAKSAFFDKKKLHYHDVQAEQENNYILKLALVEKAESIKDSTEWSTTAHALLELRDTWKKIGKVPAEKSEEIYKKFNDACDVFFIAQKNHYDQVNKVYAVNYNQKLALLKRAEELKDSIDWHEATNEMIKLMDDWKKTGPISKEHGNEMWEKFFAARKHFFDRKDADREGRKKYAEEKMSARIEESKRKIHSIKEQIKEEEAKLIDFNNALQNITPGKKAGELRSHLEKLIIESKSTLKQLKNKYDLSLKDATESIKKKDNVE